MYACNCGEKFHDGLARILHADTCHVMKLEREVVDLTQKLDSERRETERLKALLTRCEGCASETALGGGPPQYCYACWNMKERDVEHANLQVRDIATKAHAVMAALEEHGASIVPHLLDTDDNAGEELRQAVKAYFTGKA